MRWMMTAAAIFIAGPAFAQQVACGSFYDVRPGDTLQRIAVRAYGPDGSWRTLWAVNADRLRGDPSLITVGDSVFVPCLDADGRPLPMVPASDDDAMAEEDVQTEPLRLRLADAPGGGAALHAMVVEALRRRQGADGVDATPASSTDPEAGGAILPVAKPDCAPGAGQAPAVCDALVWSAPLREIVVVALTRADDAALDPRAATSLCAEAGLPDALPAAMGFAPDGLTAGPARFCLRALADGAADVAIVEASAAEAETARLGLGATVVEHTGLARTVTLHAVAAADDPAGAAVVAAIDAALDADAARGAIVARAALAADALGR